MLALRRTGTVPREKRFRLLRRLAPCARRCTSTSARQQRARRSCSANSGRIATRCAMPASFCSTRGLGALDETSGHDDHPEQAWDRVAASVLASDCQTVVMSDESLASAPADQVARGLASLADHHVHVIYGMPDFGHALISRVAAARHRVRLAPSHRRLGSTSSSQANIPPSGERMTWTTCSGVGPCRLATCTWSSPLPISSRPTDSGERFASVIGAPIDLADGAPPSDQSLRTRGARLAPQSSRALERS